MRSALILFTAVILTLATAPVFAQDTATAPLAASTPVTTPAIDPKPMSEAEKAAIENIIKTYLTQEHPEVLMEAMQELQRRDQASASAKSDAAVKASHDKIYNDSGTPVGGNPKGDVTIVEFFDYQCHYCKASEEVTSKLLKTDKNVKFIYKDFPILGPESVTAAKAALAAFHQGPDKYLKLHDALLAKKEHLSDDIIFQVAKDSGVDVDMMKKEMDGDAVAKQVQANLDLGQQIGVRGTPMFIVGNSLYPGALDYASLKKAVDDARAAKK